MRFSTLALSALAFLPAVAANAQCFNRFACNDPSAMTIRSQISINVPLSPQTSPTDEMKAMEDARRDLYTLSNRECDTLKTIFGGECTLAEVSINSSLQDRSMGAKTAVVSISNVYALKKSTK